MSVFWRVISFLFLKGYYSIGIYNNIRFKNAWKNLIDFICNVAYHQQIKHCIMLPFHSHDEAFTIFKNSIRKESVLPTYNYFTKYY